MTAKRRARAPGPRVRPRLGVWVRVRVVGVAVVITALMAGIAYRAWALQIRDCDTYRELARRQHVAMVEVPAPRGAIYDATGTELAATANVDSVYVNPHAVRDLTATAERLSALLGLDEREMEARLASPRYFAWIARHVDPADARAVREAHLGGVYLTPEPRRFYPGRDLAGPVLGFADIDGHGLDGVELTMNDLLTGRKASEAALRDATGKVMLPDASAARPVPGAAVTLTIDRTIQFIAEQTLERTVTEEKARAGVAVVLDVKTGDVLAMASRPTYDPNRPGETRKGGARNRAVTDVFEVGSVMKVFTISAALDAGVVRPDTVIDVEGGRLRIGHNSITDVDHDQELTVTGVLKRSSNVGATKIGRLLGKQGLHDALVRFGFGKKTDIELPGEQAGVLRDADRWSDIGLATVSFGYGLSVTPLQVAAGIAAIADKGIYHPPHVVREVRRPGGEVVYQRTVGERRVLGEKAALEMRPIMASVFEGGREGGTAKSLILEGFKACGKTGTAYKFDPAAGHYDHHTYLSSFAGFAPLDDPRVMVLVVIDEPHGDGHFGSEVAGPAWLDIMTRTLRYLGYPAGGHVKVRGRPEAKKKPPEAVAAGVAAGAAAGASQGAAGEGTEGGGDGGGGGGVVLEPAEAGGRVDIPDFRGMGMTQALELAARRGIQVQVSGSGKAIHQFPPPGPARTPAECRIVFEPPHELGGSARSPDGP